MKLMFDSLDGMMTELRTHKVNAVRVSRAIQRENGQATTGVPFLTSRIIVTAGLGDHLWAESRFWVGRTIAEVGPRGLRLPEVLARRSDEVHKGFREAQPAVIGMSLENARKELQRLRRATSFEEYAEQTGKGATRLRDAAHATKARRAVLVDVGFDVAVPAILELGGLVAEAWVEHKAAQQRAARREEVRRVVEDFSKQLADRAWSLWRDEGMPAAMEAALVEARTSAEGAASSLEAESASIVSALDSVNKLLVDLMSGAQRTAN